MCSRNIVSLKRIVSGKTIRWHDISVRGMSNGSYMHKLGSEPLSYVTLGQALETSAHQWPGRVALRSIHEDTTLTYEDLLTQADSLGGFLRAHGFQKGDRLGIWSHNSAAWVVAMVAAARTGLISVLINPFYEKNELKYCVNKTGMKGLLIGDKLPNRDYYELLGSLLPELHHSRPGELKSDNCPTLNSVINGDKTNLPGTYSLNSIVSDGSSYRNSITQYMREVSPDDGCVLHFTSGTSGTPKAPLSSHFSIVNNAYLSGKRFNFHEEHNKVCIQVQLFHALGSIVTLLSTLRHGSSVVLAAPFYNVDASLRALLAEQCSFISGTPTMYVDLLSRLAREGAAAARVRVALTAGAPASPHLVQSIHRYMNTESIMSLYGMTETSGGSFISLPEDNVDKVSQTIGYIMDHVEVKVVDEADKLVPFGTPGELLTRSYANMMYYWNDDEKTKETMGIDGWLRTGDKFVLTETGYGEIVGRIKDIIIRGGENIAPKEIEDLLDTHPDILESQIIGIANDRLGEELCAVLRIKPGSKITETDLANFCHGKIAKFKIPRTVKIIDVYPTTTTGKIQKYKLRDMLNSGEL